MKRLTKIWILLTVVLLTATSASVGAADFTLKGRVTDDDGNALELASVACASQARMTMTNLKGEFSMHLASADSVVVRFSMIGYRPRVRTFIRPRGTQTVLIVLHPQESLQEVTVTERRRQTEQISSRPSLPRGRHNNRRRGKACADACSSRSENTLRAPELQASRRWNAFCHVLLLTFFSLVPPFQHLLKTFKQTF